MEFSTIFNLLPIEPALRMAVLSGAFIGAITLSLLVMIAVLRYKAQRKQHQDQQLRQEWEPVFFHVLDNRPYPVPDLPKSQQKNLLVLWLKLTELVAGKARERLKQFALEIGLNAYARDLILHTQISDKLIATVALGRMGERASWGELAFTVRNPHPILSLLAIRSLLQIDPKRAAPTLMYEMGFRDDWPLRTIVAALSEIDTNQLVPDLLNSLRMARETQLPKLLRIAELVNPEDIWPALIPLLDRDRPSEIVIAALKAVKDRHHLEMVRALAEHPEWAVRTQVATTLGKIGLADDIDRLVKMLHDSQWWVRYRAATALVEFPLITRPQLHQIYRSLTDPYAAQILEQALAESAKRRIV